MPARGTFYWKKTCSTCRNARKHLEAKGISLDEREYSKKALTEDEVLAIVRAAGGVVPVLNAKHEISKEKGWKATPPDPETFARAVAKEANLIRRPIVVAGKRAIVGFDEEAYASL